MSNKFKFLTLIIIACAAIALAISSCGDPINAIQDPHFNEDGELVETTSILKITPPQQINFYVEVSGSMNGFFRGNFATNFKKDVYTVMSQLAPLTSEVKTLSNGGSIDYKMSIEQFRNTMNSGSFASTASTDMPTMLQTIINDVDSGQVAVLISDMIYDPVGNAAPSVLLTQYGADVAKIFGNAQKAVSLIAAKSEFLDKGGNISVKESPYYYVVIGEPENVAFVRNAISSLLELNESFIDNIESGFDYRQPAYSISNCESGLILDNQPTIYDYDEENFPACTFDLIVDLSNLRWIMADEDIFKKCFSIKANYGSNVTVDEIDVEVDNFNQKELKRNAYAKVKVKVTNMANDAEVLEWYLDIEKAESSITLFEPYLNAASVNDRNKTYSLENFIKGMFQGGVVNKSSDKHNYVLISKIS